MVYDHGSITSYYPYWITDEAGARMKNPKFNRESGFILDIKDNGRNVNAAMSEFLPRLLAKIKKDAAGSVQIVATIPGHVAGSASHALVDLIKTIAARLQSKPLPYLLRRTKTIDKLAHGGNRSISVHYESLEVTNHLEIAGKSILLADDVS